MSIVPLVKVTLYGLLGEKEEVLQDLQSLGCLHLIPLRPEPGELTATGPSPQTREALRFLQDCPQQRRQVQNPDRFDAEAVERRALELQHELQQLEDERDFLRQRIEDLEPWGDFRFPDLDATAGYRLWFYIVPHRQMDEVRKSGLIWEVVSRDPHHAYVVVVSPDEPQGMPVARTRAGAKPLSELRRRLEDVELEMEDRQAERASLTRWQTLFVRNLHRLEDRGNLLAAAGLTHDDTPLFALQGWMPTDHLEDLQHYARTRGLALHTEGPSEDDWPPTLLRNRTSLRAGQELVGFYMTPGYWLWDPSVVVLFSFAVFFAMILSDAGYAALLGVGLVLGWKKLGRSETGRWLRILFADLVGASVLWGVLVGSYFGLEPAPDTWLGHLKLLDVKDSAGMMTLSILVGVAHVLLANVADAWRRRGSSTVLAPFGWIVLMAGALVLWLGSRQAAASLETAGLWVMAAGAAGVLGFTSPHTSPGRRLLRGLLALTKVSNAFGDVLSYLRLFALGLASASLALAFNDLAAQVAGATPGFGKLFAFLVLLIGHGLNLLLAVVSGFIHGLRLNFIEFFNWGVAEEGYPFRAFARKESSP